VLVDSPYIDRMVHTNICTNVQQGVQTGHGMQVQAVLLTWTCGTIGWTSGTITCTANTDTQNKKNSLL